MFAVASPSDAVKLPPAEGTQYSAVEVPLDEQYYRLTPDDVAFLTQQTGLTDPEELKQHILQIQKEAYDVHPYPCIHGFRFARLKLSRLPAYPDLLKLGQERPGALFLDIGCCVGNDVRKAVADGFPPTQVLTSDLHPEFWAIGYKLFKDTPATFPATFIPGDAFDDAFLAPAPIASQPPPTPPPALAALTTLTPLHGRLSAIHASSFFHLFNEPQQLALARRLASLLSPAPGSLILGAHVGRPEKGARVESVRVNTQGVSMFCHSAESWAEMWTTEVFGPGEVKVDATLREVERVDIAPGSKSWALVWSVTRL